MAGGDLDRVREMYALLHRGDPRRLPELIHPEATWEPARNTPRHRAEDGEELAKRLLWRGGYHRLRVREAVDLHDRVLVTLTGRRMHFLGARFMSRRVFQLVTLREGRVARLEDFPTLDEALAAAGIRREPKR